MRRYKIEIQRPNSGPQTIYDSQINGINNPGALDIELDIFAFNYATPAGGGMDVKSFARVHGVPYDVISQANNLNGGSISVFGGMGRGLPLATAAADSGQYGLLAKGTIFPAFGNWIGTDMSLDLILAPSSAGSIQDGAVKPVNLSFSWKEGNQLSDAIKSTLSTAFPGATININISQNLKLNYDQDGPYSSLQQFSQYVLGISKKIVNDKNYLGVNITKTGDIINVYDGTSSTTTTAKAAKAIKFQDMIGQPTWFGFQTNFKTTMRADLQVGDRITMPPALVIQTPQASILQKNKMSFQGEYMVQQVRHIGHFRDPSAEAWVTVFDAVAVTK